MFMAIPERLRERLEKLGLSADIYTQRARKCILSRKELSLERVSWYTHAYFSDSKDGLLFDPVSLIPCLALEPDKNEKILDMCAAPGTKTFILSFITNNNAYITANDIDRNRIKRLKAIVDKYNIKCDVTNVSGRKIEGSFNKILVDAPCSGEGLINKSKKQGAGIFYTALVI